MSASNNNTRPIGGHGLPIPHDHAYVRVQFPCAPSESAMLRVGGVLNMVRAASAEEDGPHQLQFNVSNSMYGPSIASTRDTRGARLLLRLLTDEHGRTQPAIMGVVRTAFSFDGLADYYYEGSFLMRERLFPASNRRDFLNSELEPLALRPNWSLAGSDRVSDFNLSATAARAGRLKDGVAVAAAAAAESGVVRIGAVALAPQPPPLERDVVDSDVYKLLVEMFSRRPVWHKDSLLARVPPALFHTGMYSAALRGVAYSFTGGPFRRAIVRYGYDPRKDRDAARYQSIDLRYMQESTERMQSYSARIQQKEEAWLQQEDRRIIDDIERTHKVTLAPLSGGGSDAAAQADTKFIAQMVGTSAEQVKKAESERRMRNMQARKLLQQRMALELVTFAQAPTRLFAMVPLEDLLHVDPFVRDALQRNKPPAHLHERLGWLEESIHNEIQKHLKARADLLINEVESSSTTASTTTTPLSTTTAVSTGKRKGAPSAVDDNAVTLSSANAQVPNNYDVVLKVIDKAAATATAAVAAGAATTTTPATAPTTATGENKKRRTFSEPEDDEFRDARSEEE